MPARTPVSFALAFVLIALAAPALAQPPAYDTVDTWIEAPGRPLGSASAVDLDAAGNVWILERCGQNGCVDRPHLDPILLYAPSGRWLRGFGAGLFAWPHGLHVDRDGHVWVTDARAGGGRGHQVHKLDADGRVLMSLGEAGVAGAGPGHFNGPTDVLVAPNGDVFVADGHEPDSNNRIVKFSAQGEFLLEWGGSGSEPGRFLVPHALAMDSRGRLFVADRNNNRIQIFSQHGTFLEEWTQFGRPSGLYIGPDDTLYVSDNQSNEDNHPGWHRGIRVGSARDGTVWTFIPDPEFDPARAQETGAHGLAADAAGNIYGAEVWSQTVKKYRRR
ncbi:MAG TPA: peptidyl-alpha-hydroxyglycine alpha-amidating lyase family protein [Gammaproteobacteria bacterium]